MAWVQLTPSGQEAFDKTKTMARDAAAALAGQGKDALRQMNPWRSDTGQPPAKAPVSQPVSQPAAQPAMSPAATALMGGQVQAKPAAAGQPAQSVSRNENAQPNSLASRALIGKPPQQQPAPQPFRSTLPGGMTYEGDNQGNRTYIMGTPGQDGYGRVSVRPGNDPGQQARSALVTSVPQRTAQVGNGLTVTGSQDAINRLAAPVGKVDYNSPQYQQFAAQNRAKEAYVNRDAVTALASNVPQPPKYMTKEEGIAAGMGWKARAGKYREDMDAYNRLTGNQTALDVEGMREAGAGRRALLQAQGVNDQNDLAQQRLTGELGFNQARIGTELLNQQKGQMEIDQAKKLQALNDQYLAEQDPAKQKALGNQLLTMQGKSTKDWQITTREEPLDPANPMLGTTKRPYAVNLNDPNQIIELGGGGGGGSDQAMSIIEGNPAYKKAYQSADPKSQQAMLQALRERIEKGVK